MEETTDVAPVEETTEVVQHEQHLPTTEERLEHCYDEIRQLRSEIAELRSHSHADLAHATHEHPEHARADHQHDLSKAGGTTEPLEREEERREEDATPRPVHPYFRKVRFGG